MFRIIRLVTLGIFFLSSASAAADNLKGVTEMLCASVQANICTGSGDCRSSVPWDFNIPQFIVVNTRSKMLTTTPQSGENRRTRINHVKREDGLIILQGYEQGRAYSFVINEESGLASVSVSRDGKTVSVFGACTPANS